MFRFENESILYGLLLIPILILVYVYMRYRYQKSMSKYGESFLLSRLMKDKSTVQQHLKFSILCMVFACLIVALANPQKGRGTVKAKREGISIMFCVDVSNSMLAQDYTPNRIEAVKRALLSYVDKLNGDRIGIVVFAGKAFVQLPITSDYAAAKMFISNLSTQQVNTQGTDIAAALDQAAASMLPSVEEDVSKLDKTNKVIVVLSDGEDHFAEATEVAQQLFKEYNIRTYTIGVGSQQGEPIPVKVGAGVSYKKDNEGNTVITRLNEQILRDIAQEGNGVYIRANNAYLGFDVLENELNKIEKSEIEDVTYARYESKYYIPLWIALFLIVLEIFIYKRKLFNINIIERVKKTPIMKISLLFIISMSVFFSVSAQTNQELKSMRSGNRQYQQAEKLHKEVIELQKQNRQSNQSIIADKERKAQQLYESANTDYIKANTSTGNYYKSLYNQAATLYRQGKYEDAVKKLESVVENSNVSDKVKAQAYYNLGNSLLKSEKYAESIDAYKKSLKANPKDMDTKYNLEYAKKKLLMQQQQQQQQQQQNQQDKNQQNQDKNQDKNNSDNQKDNQENKNKQEQQQENQSERQKREMAKRQLDALQQNEKRTQEKVKLEERSAKPVRQEKDW